MQKGSFSFVYILSCVLLLASCAKEGPTGPTGLTGPSLTGSINGHVKLLDMYGSNVLNQLDSVKLYLNGGTTAVSPLAGAYSFTTYGGVTMVTGIYSITATDVNYATTVKNNIQLVTGALNVDIKLSAIPDSFVYTFHAYHTAGEAYDSLVMTFKPDTRQRNCIVFANSGAIAGSQPAGYVYSKVVAVSPTATTISVLIPAQDLTDAGMTSGATVYYTAYSYVIGDASVYEDITTGKNVYNAVSGAIVDSALVP